MERKQVTLFYNDTQSSVSKLVGFLIEQNNGFVKIKINDHSVQIPVSKIVRMEAKA